MAASSRSPQEVLSITKSTTLSLLHRFETTLSSQDAPVPASVPSQKLNPLDVLHTSATLLKAHTTKLSLLAINKPFTPTAITTVIRELSTSVLPAMMTAVEICSPENYGQALNKEARYRVLKVARELKSLLNEIPNGEDQLTDRPGNSRDALASTGVLWQACDAILDLKAKGLAGIVVQRAEEWRDMLNDAIAELREWSEESADDEDEEDDSDEANSTDGQFEEIFGASKSLPKGDSDIRTQLETSLKKLKLISMLYQALIKRRLKVVPPVQPPGEGGKTPRKQLETLDQLLQLLKGIPEETDELANAFYELDAKAASSHLDNCCRDAIRAVEIVHLNWKAQEDEFTSWVQDKWLVVFNA